MIKQSVVYRALDGFIAIRRCSRGYLWGLYDKSRKQFDGGLYDNPRLSAECVAEKILLTQGITMAECELAREEA